MTDLSAETFKAILGQGAQVASPKELRNGDQAFLIPEDYRLETIPGDKYALPPYVKVGASFTDAPSFIDYVNEYKTAERTKLFGSENDVAAYIDYHGVGKPEHLGHTAGLSLDFSREWSAWQQKHEKQQPQRDFAEFLEENALNVMDPDGATLLEIISNLESKKNVEFSSTVRNSDGSTALNYSENGTVEGKTSKGRIPLPQKIRLGLPVYRDGPPYPLEAWLRVRIDSGKAVFVIKLDNAEKVRRAAFKEVCDGIISATGLKILRGSVNRHPR